MTDFKVLDWMDFGKLFILTIRRIKYNKFNFFHTQKRNFLTKKMLVLIQRINGMIFFKGFTKNFQKYLTIRKKIIDISLQIYNYNLE